MLPYHEYVKAYVQWQFVDPKKHGGLILLAALADEVVQRKSIQPVDGSFEKAAKLIQLGQAGKEHGVIGNLGAFRKFKNSMKSITKNYIKKLQNK